MSFPHRRWVSHPVPVPAPVPVPVPARAAAAVVALPLVPLYVRVPGPAGTPMVRPMVGPVVGPVPRPVVGPVPRPVVRPVARPVAKPTDAARFNADQYGQPPPPFIAHRAIARAGLKRAHKEIECPPAPIPTHDVKRQKVDSMDAALAQPPAQALPQAQPPNQSPNQSLVQRSKVTKEPEEVVEAQVITNDAIQIAFDKLIQHTVSLHAQADEQRRQLEDQKAALARQSASILEMTAQLCQKDLQIAGLHETNVQLGIALRQAIEVNQSLEITKHAVAT